MSDDRVLRVEVARGVATLTLDSPANRNALSRAMRAQLREAVQQALADDAVRVLVLDHTGRVFCSGMDLAEAAGGGAEEQGVREFPDLLQLLWSSPKPVLAAVRGPAGSGCWPRATSWSPGRRPPSGSPRCGWAWCRR
jgi:methylglutaconyl-CoA hydratase